MWDMPAQLRQQQQCEWCMQHFATNAFHHEGKRYCSSRCCDHGVVAQIRAPLFEARPFPPGMSFLKARSR
jgi:hypothetical protein